MDFNLKVLGILCIVFKHGSFSHINVTVSSTFAPVIYWSRWSPWINRDTPTTDGGDEERLTAGELASFCWNGNIDRIECSTTYGIAAFASGEIMSCTIRHGLVCLNKDNFPIPCSDYKIRYFCLCYSNSVTKLSATSPPRNITTSVNTLTTPNDKSSASPRNDTSTISRLTTIHVFKENKSSASPHNVSTNVSRLTTIHDFKANKSSASPHNVTTNASTLTNVQYFRENKRSPSPDNIPTNDSLLTTVHDFKENNSSASLRTVTINVLKLTTVHDFKKNNSRPWLSTWIIVRIAVISTVILVSVCLIAIYVHKRTTKQKRSVRT